MRPINAPKDFLTNCYTREGIFPFLKKMEEEFLTNKRPFSVLILDVDHFKLFNDKYGHLYGDEVLKYFSSSLRLDLEDEENVPFRFGGDEFIMVFPNKTANDAYRLAGRLRKNIRTRSCLIKGRQLSVTFSGGIANYPGDASSADEILEKADRALYYSKNHGRGRITKHSDLAQKEFLQISGVVAILVFVGAFFYFFRDILSSKIIPAIPRLTSLLRIKPFPTTNVTGPPPGHTTLESTPPIVTPTPQTAPPAEQGQPADSQPTQKIEQPVSEISEIYLDSGRVIKGKIIKETDEIMEIELGLQEGKGVLQLKKSQVIRIDRGGRLAAKLAE